MKGSRGNKLIRLCNICFSPASRIILIERALLNRVDDEIFTSFSPASRIILIESSSLSFRDSSRIYVSVPQAGLF